MFRKYLHLMLGMLLMLGFGVVGVQAAAVDPSFELVRGVPDTCSATAGEEFRFDTLNNVSFGSGSNQATFTVDGVGQVATFTDNHNQADIYPSIGDGFYDILINSPYDVPDGTAITIEITTFTGLNQTGQLAYRSTLTFTCDLGETINLTNENLLGDINAQPVDIQNIPPADPAFEFTQGVPDMCSAVLEEEFRFDTVNNVSFGSGSNQGTLTVDGVGEVATFIGNHDQPDDYPSIGDGFYDFLILTPYDVAAGTLITAEITTFTGLNQTGQAVYRSTMTYSCDLGEVVSIDNVNLLGTAAPAPIAGIPPVDPAFEFTTGVPDTCSAVVGESITFDTLNNVTFGSGSNTASLDVAGVGIVDTIQANHNQATYPSVGDGFYEFLVDIPYNAAAGTLITAEITTYNGLNQTGQIVYRSTLTYECDTGAVVSLDNEVLLPGAIPAP